VGALTDNRAPDPGDMSEYVAWVDLLLTAALQWPDWPDSPAGSRGFGYYHHYGDKGSIYIDAPNVDAIGVMLLGALGTGPIHAREAAAYSFQALPGEAVPEVVLGCLTRYVEQARGVPGPHSGLAGISPARRPGGTKGIVRRRPQRVRAPRSTRSSHARSGRFP
jgi:hypothetical protein